MMGLQQVMVRRFDPAAVLRLIQEEKATAMALVPTMANALLNCPELRASFDLSSLQEIMLGGAASSPELIARMEAAFHCAASWPATASPRPAPWPPRARHKSTVTLCRRRRPPAPPGHGRLAAARLRDPRGRSRR